MDAASFLRSRRGAIVIGAVGVLVVLLAWVLTRDAEEPSWEPTPLQQVLREIRPDGTWSMETALRAFSAAVGPLPGVVVPEGPEAEVEFGTIAIRMLRLYFDDITPEQREAALDLAGPLAKYLDPTTETSRQREVITMGIPSVLGAPADDYEAAIAVIVAGIESRVGRPLGIDYEVSVAEEQTGIFHATAQAVAGDGENISRCEITIFPKAQALSGKNLTSVLAHETWHCFQDARLGTLSRDKGAPPWIVEGQAMWVGEAFVGGSEGLEPAIRHWNEYLIDPGPGVGLFARSYDAIGFLSHLHDRGIDPWTVLDTMLDQTSNLAAYEAAVQGDGSEVLLTWAPGWFRDGSPTSTFSLINAPGIPGPESRPAPSTFTISNGVFQQVPAIDPLSAAVAEVAIESEILTIDVTGRALVGDMVFGGEIPFVWSKRAFCMSEECTCPDGSPGPTDHIGDELRVAVTGDTLTGSDALLRGWSISEWCGESEEPPPAPGSPGGGGPCDQGCGSSNGDPHLTTIDGRSYDFQAAGEFVALRSDQVEIQVRQEPYQGSDSVTINTAVAVGAGSHRAMVTAGPRLLADGAEVEPGEVVGELATSRVPGGIQLVTPDGTVVTVLGIGEWGLHLVVSPSPQLRAQGVGLLAATGSGFFPAMADGSELDDGDIRTGLYTEFADGWAVTPETTLFEYPDGAGPDDYRDRALPVLGAPLDFSELPATLQEEGLAGCPSIADMALRLQCAFDIAVTGDPGFAVSYQDVDAFFAGATDDPPSSGTGDELQPVLTEVAAVTGSALSGDGTLYLSLTYEDRVSELVSIDPVTQTVLARSEIEDRGPIAIAHDSIWLSGSGAGGCLVQRFDLDLELIASVEVDCVLSFLTPQLVSTVDGLWVYQDDPALRAIDPVTNTLGDTVSVPFASGFLRSTDDTIFYSDIEQGVYRLDPDSTQFELLHTGHPIVYPGGNGVWVEEEGAVIYHDQPAGPGSIRNVDGDLVGAVGETALVDLSGDRGPELWAYPADGNTPPTLLLAGPIVVGDEGRQTLDFFDDYPPLSAQGRIVKLWVEHDMGGEGAGVFVQAIPRADD